MTVVPVPDVLPIAEHRAHHSVPDLLDGPGPAGLAGPDRACPDPVTLGQPATDGRPTA